MRTIRTKVYKFKELTTEAQKKAVELLYDVNTDFEWYEPTYEDAENVGLKIEGFDLDRMNCNGRFIDSASDCAFKIIREHGEHCNTYQTAKAFLAEYDKLVAKYSDGNDLTRVTHENEYDFDNEADELEEDFRKCILEDYRCMLQNDYDYQTSEKSIIETIEANEYEFYANGKLI